MSSHTASPAEEKQPAFFYGWVVVGVGFVTLGMAFGVWYSFSVFFLAVIEEFGWSRAATSSIFSVFIISQSLMNLLTGHLQDRFGPRVIIPFGTVLLSLCLAVTSRAHSLWHFYLAYGVFAGAGVSLLGFSSHAGFIPKWFERQRGLALGIAMSGIGFGMLFLIPLAEKSITLFGWRDTYLYMAAVLLFTVCPLNAFLSRRSPQAMGLMPDGDGPDQRRRNRRIAVTIKVVDASWAGEDWTLQKAARTRRFWLLAVAFFLVRGCIRARCSIQFPPWSILDLNEAWRVLFRCSWTRRGCGENHLRLPVRHTRTRAGQYSRGGDHRGGASLSHEFAVGGRDHAAVVRRFLRTGVWRCGAPFSLRQRRHISGKVIRFDFCHDLHRRRPGRIDRAFYDRVFPGYRGFLHAALCPVFRKPRAVLPVYLDGGSEKNQAYGAKSGKIK